VTASLPYDDPSVAALDAATRSAIAQHWTRRARAELEVGRAFSAMARRLDGHAAPTVVTMLASSADEEVLHSGICVRLAETYAGATIDAPQIESVPLPAFGYDDDRELEDALLVAGQCCINETIATAWLSACRAIATSPLAIAANRFHLQDEVTHARIGWAHLAQTSAKARSKLASLLPALLAANLPHWEAADPSLPEDGVPSHGLLGVERTREVVRAAVHDLVLPGFDYVGIDTARARR
jgi:hypothetical protein